MVSATWIINWAHSRFAHFSLLTSIIGYVPLIGKYLSGAVTMAIFVAAFIVCIPLFFRQLGSAGLSFTQSRISTTDSRAHRNMYPTSHIIFTSKKLETQEMKSIKHLSHMLKKFFDLMIFNKYFFNLLNT